MFSACARVGVCSAAAVVVVVAVVVVAVEPPIQLGEPIPLADSKMEMCGFAKEVSTEGLDGSDGSKVLMAG